MKEASLLLEIFSEEIPHLEILKASDSLAVLLKKALEKAEIPFGETTKFSTPKRLAILVKGVPTELRTARTLIQGPPRKISYEKEEPTKAFKGWVKQIGQTIPDKIDFLREEETQSGIYFQKEKKGDSLVYLKTASSKKTSQVLSSLLVEVIEKITFAKTMHWADRQGPFVRPVHSFCALLGEAVIPFELWGVKSSNFTFGHAQLSPVTINLKRAEDYQEELRRHQVIASVEEREKLIIEQINELCVRNDIDLFFKEKVISLVVNLVEYPHLILAEFNREFLKLPRELIISELMEHQKYFPVQKNGELTHLFVITSNILAEKEVKRGNQKVLRARLNDGNFLYQTDLELGLDEMHAKLAKVVFQEKLGSYQAKVERIARLAHSLNKDIGYGVAKDLIQEGANLIKSDLTSHLVNEFPHLQGVIGYYYAQHENRDELVSLAIREHYLPVGSRDPLPQNRLSLLLSLADKMDNILSLFSVGLVPTSSQDRYGLKRQGFAVVRILIEKKITIDLFRFFQQHAENYTPFLAAKEGFAKEAFNSWSKDIENFFLTRFHNYVKEKGISGEDFSAIQTGDGLDPHLWWEKLLDLAKFRASPNYEGLLTLFKRVENIIGPELSFDEVIIEQSYFENEEEKKLWMLKKDLDVTISSMEREGHSFYQVLALLSKYEKVLDGFFAKVLVNHQDKRIRSNRIHLLKSVYQQIRRIVNLGALSPK